MKWMNQDQDMQHAEKSSNHISENQISPEDAKSPERTLELSVMFHIPKEAILYTDTLKHMNVKHHK